MLQQEEKQNINPAVSEVTVDKDVLVFYFKLKLTKSFNKHNHKRGGDKIEIQKTPHVP